MTATRKNILCKKSKFFSNCFEKINKLNIEKYEKNQQINFCFYFYARLMVFNLILYINIKCIVQKSFLISISHTYFRYGYFEIYFDYKNHYFFLVNFQYSSDCRITKDFLCFPKTFSSIQHEYTLKHKIPIKKLQFCSCHLFFEMHDVETAIYPIVRVHFLIIFILIVRDLFILSINGEIFKNFTPTVPVLEVGKFRYHSLSDNANYIYCNCICTISLCTRITTRNTNKKFTLQFE